MCSSTWLAGEETLAAEKTACFSLCRHAGPQRKTPRLWQAERGKERTRGAEAFMRLAREIRLRIG